MISLSTAKAVIFTLGPLALPKLISYYRTVRAQSTTSPLPVQALPKDVHRSLNILFVSAIFAVISTLPYFAPENIFDITSSRLQTPTDVLFTRLGALRGGPDNLTEDDKTLRPKLASMDARLLYLTYGPDVLTHCTFCFSDEPTTYLYYALPSILLPHIFHLFALGLATSSIVAGKWGSRWRTWATYVGFGVAFIDAYLIGTFDYKKNARVFHPSDYVRLFWNMRLFRGVSVAVCDVVLAGLLYLSSTNRLFVVPPSPAERTESALKLLEMARGKMNAVGILRNAVVRDEALRKRTEAYWIREGTIMGEVMSEREVVEGVRNALESRVQVSKIEEDANKFAEGITVVPGPQMQVNE